MMAHLQDMRYACQRQRLWGGLGDAHTFNPGRPQEGYQRCAQEHNLPAARPLWPSPCMLRISGKCSCWQCTQFLKRAGLPRWRGWLPSNMSSTSAWATDAYCMGLTAPPPCQAACCGTSLLRVTHQPYYVVCLVKPLLQLAGPCITLLSPRSRADRSMPANAGGRLVEVRLHKTDNHPAWSHAAVPSGRTPCNKAQQGSWAPAEGGHSSPQPPLAAA